jgi:hypothetical protein
MSNFSDVDSLVADSMNKLQEAFAIALKEDSGVPESDLDAFHEAYKSLNKIHADMVANIVRFGTEKPITIHPPLKLKLKK